MKDQPAALYGNRQPGGPRRCNTGIDLHKRTAGTIDRDRGGHDAAMLGRVEGIITVVDASGDEALIRRFWPPCFGMPHDPY